MTSFRYTPAMVRWIRAHAGMLNERDMAAHLTCAVSSLRNICRNFQIDLCRDSDPHADLAPFATVPAPPLAPAKPLTHPRLNPELRGNYLVEAIELRIGREAVTRLNRAAAARRTSATVLAAVLLELIAADNLFDAVLNLDD